MSGQKVLAEKRAFELFFEVMVGFQQARSLRNISNGIYDVQKAREKERLRKWHWSSYTGHLGKTEMMGDMVGKLITAHYWLVLG